MKRKRLRGVLARATLLALMVFTLSSCGKRHEGENNPSSTVSPVVTLKPSEETNGPVETQGAKEEPTKAPGEGVNPTAVPTDAPAVTDAPTVTGKPTEAPKITEELTGQRSLTGQEKVRRRLL